MSTKTGYGFRSWYFENMYMFFLLTLLCELFFIFLNVLVWWWLSEVKKKEELNVDVFYCCLIFFIIPLLVLCGFVNYGIFNSIFYIFCKLNYKFIVALFVAIFILNWFLVTTLLIVFIDECLKVIKNETTVSFFSKLRRILIILSFFLFVQTTLKLVSSFIKKNNDFNEKVLKEESLLLEATSKNKFKRSEKFYNVSEFFPCNYKYYHFVKTQKNTSYNYNYKYTISDLLSCLKSILKKVDFFFGWINANVKNLNFINFYKKLNISEFFSSLLHTIVSFTETFSLSGSYRFCYFLKKINLLRGYFSLFWYNLSSRLDSLLIFVLNPWWTVLTFIPFIFLFFFIFYNLISVYALRDFKGHYLKNKWLCILDFFLIFACSLCYIGLVYGDFYYFMRNDDYYNVIYDYSASGGGWKNKIALNIFTLVLLNNPYLLFFGILAHHWAWMTLMYSYLLEPAGQNVHNNYTYLCCFLMVTIVSLDLLISFEIAPILFFWAIHLINCVYVWLYFKFLKIAPFKYKILSIVIFYAEIIFLAIIGLYFFFVYYNFDFFTDSINKADMNVHDFSWFVSGRGVLKLISIVFFFIFFFISILLSVCVEFLYLHFCENIKKYKKISEYTRIFNMLRRLTYVLIGISAFCSCCRITIFISTTWGTAFPTILKYVIILFNFSFILMNLMFLVILLLFVYLVYHIVIKK